MALSDASRKALEERLMALDAQKTRTQIGINTAQGELDKQKAAMQLIDRDIAAINTDLGRTA